MEYMIVRNNKATVKCVFDYMMWSELKNLKPHQKKLLNEVCDGIEFLTSSDSIKNILITKTRSGDYLYQQPLKGEFGKLVGINKHSTSLNNSI